MSHLTEQQQDILLESGTNELEIVEFQLHRQLSDGTVKVGYFGINVAKVREIIRVPETTEYPNSHPSVLGIFNLRERLIPLIDLSHWLRLATPSESRPEQKAIITEFNNSQSSFLVDGINRIHRISWEHVESPSQFLESRDSDCVVAVIRMSNRLIMILDFEKIFADINPSQSMESYDVSTDKKIDKGQDMVERRQSKTVFIADDSAFIRKLIQTTLSTAGYRIVSANDGAEAFDMLMEYEQSARLEGVPLDSMVNLLISDVEMPRMDGLHLVKRMRERDEFRYMPILMFSSIMSDENRRKALQLGADDTITKPQIGKLLELTDHYVFGES
ncbi:chemotaxis protein CheV [Desulfurispira natronophila]|uniref:Two-component system chemotaxis response regulator CheV n=1 Tax=Desulfurispira natronophila TaxID=682562 RepID=A0A7W8DHT9_9BACT|nr:chemotaxis protein [Desulfurispira natronophila]MBB5022799.1 two-component system chemotaxis response regulator CheV [Desulfurispira natronophila]